MINEKGYEVPDGVAADMVVLTKKEGEYFIVLIERAHYPFGCAIPGGHLDPDETFKECAVREFEEECNVKLPIGNARLLNEYSEPGMDPRGRYVSVAYMAIVESDTLQTLKAKDDAKKVFLCKLQDALDGKVEFAFKHHKMMVHDVSKKIKTNA
jgi:8-oxo-dGTP diphosphatase